MRVQNTLTTLLIRFGNKQTESENEGECVWKMMYSFYHKTNKEASIGLCTVVKHLTNGDSTHEVAGRNTQLRLVFPPALISSSWVLTI